MHPTASDVGTTVLFLSGVGAVSGFDEPLQHWLEANPDAAVLRPFAIFGEGSPVNLLGRTMVLVPLSAAAWMAGVAFDRQTLRDAGLGCMTANVANTLARFSIAKLVGRPRPMTGRPASEILPLRFGQWEERSFPGGHAANAMACASALAHRFDLGAGEPLLYGLATLIGLTRTVESAHWLSDSAFGLGFGFAVGKEVARLQEARGRAAPEPAAVLYWQISF